jgi:NAD(P)H-hydrate repair Nnr-like enzyme with NAD(P)H-hydrate dehydratase domain
MMDHTYWHKQTSDEPLFPELLWSRPENKRHAGKLLIVGGNSFGFSAVGEAYMAAVTSGIGTARVLLPEAIRKVVGVVLEHAEFAASNPSGGFAKDALGELLEQTAWSDATLLAGDFGKNSETSVLLETFVQKTDGLLAICGDALDNLKPSLLLGRKNTLLVVNRAQLQKLVTGIGFTTAVTAKTDFIKIIEILHELTLKHPGYILLVDRTQVIVACSGQVSTTPLQTGTTQIGTAATVWWLQNPDKPFEALTTTVVSI